MQCHGTVAPGFEPVRQLYEQQTRTMAEENTQLCVHYCGEKVVDLWPSAAADGSFSADSLVNVFSSGKSLGAIAMAALVSKGLLRYDAHITDYWPEFGANGKEGLKIADLMRHEAGLANFDTSFDMEDLECRQMARRYTSMENRLIITMTYVVAIWRPWTRWAVPADHFPYPVLPGTPILAQ